MRLFFFTGRDGEWRLGVDSDGEVTKASRAVCEWYGRRVDRAAIKVGAKPREIGTGLQFPRKVDMILTDEGDLKWH